MVQETAAMHRHSRSHSSETLLNLPLPWLYFDLVPAIYSSGTPYLSAEPTELSSWSLMPLNPCQIINRYDPDQHVDLVL